MHNIINNTIKFLVLIFEILFMFDTHAHLNWPESAKRIDRLITDSKKAGLTGIIVVSSNVAESEVSVDLAKKYPGYLYSSVGIHPQQTDPENKDSISKQLKNLEEFIALERLSSIATKGLAFCGLGSTKIVAIGECGLDYSPAPPGEKDRSQIDQEKLFIGQIELAVKYELPLIIHARQANNEVIETLAKYPKSYGVFHCYSGGKKRISRILSFPGNWYFGFDGNITYDEGLVTVLKEIPPKRLLIETDSPLLAPVPFRYQTNEPRYLPYIQNKINQVFKKDLTRQIEDNSRQLFKLNSVR